MSKQCPICDGDMSYGEQVEECHGFHTVGHWLSCENCDFCDEWFMGAGLISCHAQDFRYSKNEEREAVISKLKLLGVSFGYMTVGQDWRVLPETGIPF